MMNWKVLPEIWHEQCMVCGDEVEIKTDREDLSLLYEDDEVRCSDPECHTQASVIVDAGEEIAYLHWIEETCKRPESYF